MVQPKVIKYQCKVCNQLIAWDETNGFVQYLGRLSTHPCLVPTFDTCDPRNAKTEDFDVIPTLTRLTYTH